MNTVICDGCGVEYGIGRSPYCKDGHGPWLRESVFTPYFDIGLGEYVSNHGERSRFMRRKGLDYSGRKVGDPGCEV